MIIRNMKGVLEETMGSQQGEHEITIVATTRRNGTRDPLTSVKLTISYLVVGIYKRT